jgi:large subunit ribosomal protein L25
MAEAVVLRAEPRDPKKNRGTGTRVARRLRAQGRVPAIVYGHKQAPMPISLARDDAWELFKRSSHVAQLQIGEATEMVLIREIQWDHLGKEILHLDFSRVSAEESIETEVRIEPRGAAPGLHEGGILEFLVHSVKVVCRATDIPDAIRADLSGLHLGQALHVRDLVVPPGVTVHADPDQLLLHIVAPRAAAEPTAAATAAAEEAPAQPELIRARDEKKEKEE